MYLTHLDYADTESIMTEKLHNQVNGTEWSWQNLNTVSSHTTKTKQNNYFIKPLPVEQNGHGEILILNPRQYRKM